MLQQIDPGVELEQTSELPPPSPKDTKRTELEPTGPVTNNHSRTGDVEPTQGISIIKDGARMSNPLSFSPSSTNFLHLQSQHHNGSSILVATEGKSPSSGSLEVTQITNPQHLVKDRVNLSRRSAKASEHKSNSTSSSPPPSMSTPRARVEVRPFPIPTPRVIHKSSFTVLSQSRSSSSFPISDDAKPPVSKRRKTHHHHTFLDARAVSNPKSQHRPSSLASSFEASASRVDLDTLSTFEYDLDRDPTQQAYEFHDHFHERSPYSAVLSARFIHAHLFEILSDSPTTNELTNSEGDLVTEFTNAAALNSVGSQDVVSLPHTFTPAEVFGNSGPVPPGYGDIDLEGPAHVTDPFTTLTIDDVINHQPWGPDPGAAINPSLINGAPAFSEPRSPSPAPTFRDFHSWKRPHTPSPLPALPALTNRLPSRTPASMFGSDSAKTPRNSEGTSGGGKAKFYKKGTLQAPPHLSSSQRRRSVSAKTTESIHTSRHPSPDQVALAETGSPLTEFSATSMSSVMTPIEVTNAVGESPMVVGRWSGTPSHRASTKTVTARKRKSATDQKGPYRIFAVNESTHCHQCRRTTSHPKMRCRACTKHYCILCIVKRYHDIEFHQFKKDFDCPACLDECNCTACCYKRKEVYVTTRHIKFDRDTMAKLLSGEIRSLPHPSTTPPGPHKKSSSKYSEPTSTARQKKTLARQKRVSSRRYTSHDDYDESDASKAQNAGVRAKPAQATLQTQRMLEESGSGRYWGAVYSLSGERIGMSYVGNDLQNVTLRTVGSPSASATDYSPSHSRHRRRRIYVGRWQDTWGSRPESLDDSLSEDGTRANKQSRNRDLGRARCYYVGNRNVIGAWQKAQSKVVQRPPVVPISPFDIDIYMLPSDPPFDNPSARDQRETTNAPPNEGIPADGEGEDEGDGRSFWIMEDGPSPKKPNLPLPVTTDTSRPGLDDVINVLSGCSTPALESHRQLVTREDLVKAVTSSLQAVGTDVLLPGPPLSPLPSS